MIWDPLKDRAQFLYQTLEKVGFSSGNYRELLDLYNERVNKYSQKNNELLDGIPIETEQKILREVACEWLNKEDEPVIPYSIVNNSKHAVLAMNYDRWNILGEEKQELHIAGIFPMSGNKYRAPELVPSKYDTIFKYIQIYIPLQHIIHTLLSLNFSYFFS